MFFDVFLWVTFLHAKNYLHNHDPSLWMPSLYNLFFSCIEYIRNAISNAFELCDAQAAGQTTPCEELRSEDTVAPMLCRFDRCRKIIVPIVHRHLHAF